MEQIDKIKILLKKYGASDEEIKNFLDDLANFVEEEVKDKIEEIFDADIEEDFEIGEE